MRKRSCSKAGDGSHGEADPPNANHAVQATYPLVPNLGPAPLVFGPTPEERLRQLQSRVEFPTDRVDDVYLRQVQMEHLLEELAEPFEKVLPAEPERIARYVQRRVSNPSRSSSVSRRSSSITIVAARLS